MISEFEIARAKAAGAAGVTVVLALVGPERAAELAAFCRKLGGWAGRDQGRTEVGAGRGARNAAAA